MCAVYVTTKFVFAMQSVIRKSLVAKFKRERLPLTDLPIIMERKKKFGTPGKCRPKRKAEELTTETSDDIPPHSAKIERTGVSN